MESVNKLDCLGFYKFFLHTIMYSHCLSPPPDLFPGSPLHCPFPSSLNNSVSSCYRLDVQYTTVQYILAVQYITVQYRLAVYYTTVQYSKDWLARLKAQDGLINISDGFHMVTHFHLMPELICKQKPLFNIRHKKFIPPSLSICFYQPELNHYY